MKQKGFTIIELIVVISIIAVLSVIVVTSVTGYIQRAKNAALKANLEPMAAAATAYFTLNGTFGNLCNSPEASKISGAVTRIGGIFTCIDPQNTQEHDWSGCEPPAEKWVAYIAYTGFGTLLNCYCIDSSGNKNDGCGDTDDCNCGG